MLRLPPKCGKLIPRKRSTTTPTLRLTVRFITTASLRVSPSNRRFVWRRSKKNEFRSSYPDGASNRCVELLWKSRKNRVVHGDAFGQNLGRYPLGEAGIQRSDSYSCPTISSTFVVRRT